MKFTFGAVLVRHASLLKLNKFSHFRHVPRFADKTQLPFSFTRREGVEPPHLQNAKQRTKITVSYSPVHYPLSSHSSLALFTIENVRFINQLVMSVREDVCKKTGYPQLLSQLLEFTIFLCRNRLSTFLSFCFDNLANVVEFCRSWEKRLGELKMGSRLNLDERKSSKWKRNASE